MANTDLRFDVQALDRASQAFTRIGQAVEKFEKRLQRLDGQKVTADVGVNTEKAEAEVGKFATEARRKLEAALKALPQLELTADSSDVDRDVARIRNELEALHGQRIGVDIDSAEFLAQVHRLEAELQQLSSSSPDVQVRADTGAALAQLVAFGKEVDKLDGRDATVGLDVDDKGTVAAAVTGLTNVQKYALLAAAAAPLVGAGFVALPGLIMTAAVPLATIATGVEGISSAAASLAPEFRQVQTAVSAAFVTGLAPALANASKLIPVLQTGMVGTASALSSVATQVTGVVSSAAGLQQVQSIFSGVNTVVASLGPGVAHLTSTIMSLAQTGLAGLQPLGQVIDSFATSLGAVVDQLNASGATQAAVSGLVGVLGGLLSVIPPLVQAGTQLMAAIGPPLAAALHVVGAVLGFLTGPLGGVTTAVIALATAWKLSSLAGAAFATLGSKIQSGWSRVGSALSGANAGLVATSAAAATASTSGEKAATSAGKVSSAFAKIGNTLPVVGAVIIGLGMAYESLIPNAEDAASAMIAGGDAATQAAKKLREQNDQFREGSILGDLFRVTQSDINAEVEKQISLMPPLQAAQARVNVAQADLNEAIRQFTPNSQQARDATAAYQQKLIDLQKAQSDAAIQGASLGLSFQSAAQHFAGAGDAADATQQSVVLLADAFTNLSDPLQTASAKAEKFSAVFAAASDAPTQLAVATQAVNDAMRGLDDAADKGSTKLISLNGTIDTTTEAGSKLQTAVLGTASAIQNNYGASITAAVAGGKDLNVATAEATAQFEKQKTGLVNLLVQQGANRGAAEQLADTLLATPPAITTTISQPGMLEAVANAMGLKGSIVAIPDNKSIIVNSLTDTARQQLTDLGLQVTTLPNGQILVTADGSPAREEVVTTVTFANGQTGVVTVDANNQPADGKTTASVRFADGSVGTVTFDGNNIPANGQVDATVRYGNGQTARIKIGAVDAGAMQTARDIARSISGIQAAIKVVSTPFGATGMVYPATRFATGGVHRYAGGGVEDKPPGRPFRAGFAQVFPPNRLRYTGDRTRDDEFYIPDDDAPRSMGLLRELARRRGLGLTPLGRRRGFARAAAGLARFAPGRAGVTIDELRGAGGPAAPTVVVPPSQGGAQLAAAVSALREGLRDVARAGITAQDVQQLVAAVRDARPITVEDHSGNPVETARAAALALRFG